VVDILGWVFAGLAMFMGLLFATIMLVIVLDTIFDNNLGGVIRNWLTDRNSRD
jgi:hypothetical protein